jgi:hypothetical protein
MRTSTPFSPQRSVVTFICERQAALGISDADVAAQAGYSSERAYRLLKAGQMKLNVERIPDLAGALRVEPGELLTVALADYESALLKVLQECAGPVDLSCSERQIIEHARRVASGNNRLLSVIINGVPLLLHED